MPINLSECSLRILSIPAGKVGKPPEGLAHILCCVNQKHLSHCFIKDIEDGESLKVFINYKEKRTIKT